MKKSNLDESLCFFRALVFEKGCVQDIGKNEYRGKEMNVAWSGIAGHVRDMV